MGMLGFRGALALLALASSALACGCGDTDVELLRPVRDGVMSQPGTIGDPCIPRPESDATWNSINTSSVLIDLADATCETGVCIVNRFQGRVSCPLGQAAPVQCSGLDDEGCGDDIPCVDAGPWPFYCDSGAPDQGAGQCAGHGGVCNPQSGTCECQSDMHCPDGAACDVGTKQCKRYVCRPPAGCQVAGASAEENEGKICCTMGTGAPVVGAVCGQCAEGSGRSAEEAVYCSCRCGPAEGAPHDPTAEYCACPSGFECAEIFPYGGSATSLHEGKYCIKPGTNIKDPEVCGEVQGYFDATCKGTPANP